MNKACERREQLLDMLDGGREYTLEEIAGRLGLSVRQVRRLLDDLRAEGKTVNESHRGHHKYFSLAEKDWLVTARGIKLTDEECLSLTVAAEASRATLQPTPLGRPLESGFNQLLKRLNAGIHTFEVAEEGENWHVGAGATAAIDPVIFKQLENAVRKQHRVWIDYVTASTGEEYRRRPIEPYGLAVRGGTWLVVAYCCLRKEMRDFSVAGITSVQVAGHDGKDIPESSNRIDDNNVDDSVNPEIIFTVPEGFSLEQYFQGRFSALDGGTPVTVKLLVDADRAVYFRRKQYHPSQIIEETRDDGRIVVSFSVKGLDEIRSFAQGWGVRVTVLEPPELIDRVLTEARELVRRYESASVVPTAL